MRIKEICPCGAMFEVECESTPIVVSQFEAWLNRHEACVEMPRFDLYEKRDALRAVGKATA